MYRVIGTVKSRAFRVLWMLEELRVILVLSGDGTRPDEWRNACRFGHACRCIKYSPDRRTVYRSQAGWLRLCRRGPTSDDRSRGHCHVFCATDLDAIQWQLDGRHHFEAIRSRRVRGSHSVSWSQVGRNGITSASGQHGQTDKASFDYGQCGRILPGRSQLQIRVGQFSERHFQFGSAPIASLRQHLVAIGAPDLRPSRSVACGAVQGSEMPHGPDTQ